jgi:quercetin dioxygenase-like cupin family protein
MVGPFAAPDAQLVSWRPGVETRLHTGASRGAKGLCVIEQWCEPGAGAPVHTHFDVEEVIAVLDGVADVSIDGITERVGAGGAIVLPPGSWHGFTNAGDGTLHTVAAFASARPAVAYESDPETVLEIGVAGERMLDAHRAYRDNQREAGR